MPQTLQGFRHALALELAKTAAYPASRLTPESSNVSGYRYDAAAQQLEVTFKSGGTYRYKEVPPQVAKALGRNKSAGKTINRLVKGGGYAYEKIGNPLALGPAVAALLAAVKGSSFFPHSTAAARAGYLKDRLRDGVVDAGREVGNLVFGKKRRAAKLLAAGETAAKDIEKVGAALRPRDKRWPELATEITHALRERARRWPDLHDTRIESIAKRGNNLPAVAGEFKTKFGGGRGLPKEAAGVVASFARDRRSLIKRAGVAKKQITWDGLRMKIEVEPGDTRTGKSKDGTTWSRKMFASYGYIPGTSGMGDDGEAIDVYFAADPVENSPVFQVDQLKMDTGEHDENKYMIGWPSLEEAKKAYLQHMPAKAFGSIKQVTDHARDFAGKINMAPMKKTAGAAIEYNNNFPSVVSPSTLGGGPTPGKHASPPVNPPPKPAPANVSPPNAGTLGTPMVASAGALKHASMRSFVDELTKTASSPLRSAIKQAGASDFILGEVPGGSVIQRGIAGGPKAAAKAFAGSAIGGVPGALAGMGAGKLIQHLAHHGRPINVPGVGITLPELLAGVGGTIGAVKGLRHFAPGSKH
jgi:hypothetical protein